MADIAALQEKIRKLQAQKNRLMAQRTDARRKRDAHCKILIGGAVIALADGGDSAMRCAYDQAFAHARERGESEALELDAWLADREEMRQEREARDKRKGRAAATAAESGAQPAGGEVGGGSAG